jgi:hypothetical protein
MTALVRTILFAGATLFHVSAFAQASPNAIPKCEPQQLTAGKALGPDGGAGNSASVFQVVNSSRQTCILTGVPILRLLNERDQPLNLTICANCEDYIFPAKAIGIVTLHSGDAAHFLMGLRFADESESRCGKLSRVDLLLNDSVKPLEFDFGGWRVCGKIDVSAWRTGVYTDKELQTHPTGGDGTGF